MQYSPLRLILRKRDGYALTGDEIRALIAAYTSGQIPDYQMSALLMAIYFRGMTAEETSALTLAMVESGERVDLSAIPGFKVDKHSTGGVGDKTTLVLAPLVAACGLPVAKMSGRGLGHTGGTLDKLESIPGLRTDLDSATFARQVSEVGLAVISQSGNLAPADGLLYALRDVTGTVESLPLIASSVMSKKIAAGADGIVLDVKTGQGAFMRDPEQAIALARTMVELGRAAGRPTAALISRMDQPLGWAIGNALELQEAVLTLSGQGPDDLLELCLALGQRMLLLAGHVTDAGQARLLLQHALQSGAARKKLAAMIVAQGGDRAYIDEPARLATAPVQRDVLATRSGIVVGIDTLGLGLLARDMGAGRQKKGDPIDHRIGIINHLRIGDHIAQGQPLATIHAASVEAINNAASALVELYTIGDRASTPLPLIVDAIA